MDLYKIAALVPTDGIMKLRYLNHSGKWTLWVEDGAGNLCCYEISDSLAEVISRAYKALTQ